MARKRQRRRPPPTTAVNYQGHHTSPANGGVQIRRLGAHDEGLLCTHRVIERRGGARHRGFFSKLFRRTPHHRSHALENNVSSVNGTLKSGTLNPVREDDDDNNNMHTPMRGNLNALPKPSSRHNDMMPMPMQSDTLQGFKSFYGDHQRQYTILSKKKYGSKILNWFDEHHMNIMDFCCHNIQVDSNVYRPSTFLYRYILWTFSASYTSVTLTFLLIYVTVNLVFGGLLYVAGTAEPYCITASGEQFGAHPQTKFSDAFALSWTTFTTVGYGMTYTSTSNNLGDTLPHECTWTVFLCTSEAFLGLLFAGMCAAILYGKVNRTQSHANIMFSNAVCIQYEEEEDEIEDDEEGSDPPLFSIDDDVAAAVAKDEENQLKEETKFVDQYNGCPILKFQVVNELANQEGGELVDCFMKAVGVKFKGRDGNVTEHQYVRVNLVDYEHPFLSRIWHGVHILDASSPLLTDAARERIRENSGSWPSKWFDPEIIRSKLDFHDLNVMVTGLSNISAVTVHAYKRYKIGDVLIGFNFAPIVFRDVDSGNLEVDLSMSNDVREQAGMRGENLSFRQTVRRTKQLSTTIQIMKSFSEYEYGGSPSSRGNSLGVDRATFSGDDENHHAVATGK